MPVRRESSAGRYPPIPRAPFGGIGEHSDPPTRVLIVGTVGHRALTQLAELFRQHVKRMANEALRMQRIHLTSPHQHRPFDRDFEEELGRALDGFRMRFERQGQLERLQALGRHLAPTARLSASELGRLLNCVLVDLPAFPAHDCRCCGSDQPARTSLLGGASKTFIDETEQKKWVI